MTKPFHPSWSSWRVQWIMATLLALSSNWLVPAALCHAGEPKLRATLAHAKGIDRAFLSADGKRLVTWSRGPNPGNRHGAIILWDSATGKRISTLVDAPPVAGRVRGRGMRAVGRPVFSPDGKVVAAIVESNRGRVLRVSPQRLVLVHGEIRLWDAATGKQVRTWLTRHVDVAYPLMFSPDGKTLVARTGGNCKLQLWDVATGKERFTPDRNLRQHVRIANVAFSADSKLLAVVRGVEKVVRLWDLEGNKLVHSWRCVQPPLSVAFSEDYQLLAAGLIGTAPRQPPGPKRPVVIGKDPPYSWKGSKLFGAATKVWKVATGKERVTLPGHNQSVSGLTFLPRSKLLAVQGHEEVNIWNLSTGKRQGVLKHDGPLAWTAWGSGTSVPLLFTADGKLLGSIGGTQVKLWDLTAGKEATTFRHTTGVTCAAFSADGKLLVTGTNVGQVTLWEVNTGRRLWSAGIPRAKPPAFADRRRAIEYRQPGISVSSVAFANGDRTLVAVTGAVTLWDLPTSPGSQGGNAR